MGEVPLLQGLKGCDRLGPGRLGPCPDGLVGDKDLWCLVAAQSYVSI